MAKRQLKQRNAPQKQTANAVVAPADRKPADELKAKLDDLLDEIDDVLVENPAQFVKEYVQKGGQ